jgi:molybdate transport system permease protein
VAPARRRIAAAALRAGAVGLGAGLILLLGLPLLSLVLRITPAALLDRLREPPIVQALGLSLLTSLAATISVIALGLPVAYALAMAEFRGKRLLELLIELPLVLPPTVAGVALLTAFGRTGLAGGALGWLGVTLPFTTLGVVVAQAFVAAPFFVGAARAGFAEVDRKYLDTAATLRAPPAVIFLRVLAPLAAPSLLAGAAMSWARALGEFGATITFAGNMPGVTQTMPLAVYLALQSDVDAAVALSVLLLALSLAVLVGIRLVSPRFVGLPGRARRPRR